MTIKTKTKAIKRLRDPKRTVYTDTWRAKWATDGAKTLKDAASMLRLKADLLEKMAKAGIELSGEVRDDYGFLKTTDPVVAEEFGFVNEAMLEKEQPKASREAVTAAFDKRRKNEPLTDIEKKITGAYYGSDTA